MVDIHSHILPGVDDGAKTWDIAVEMCRMAAEDGITHMVATPHANELYAYDRRANEATLAKLQEKADGAVGLTLGCDFHMSFDNIVALREDPAEFCIGSTNYLLVEFSDFGISRQLLEVLEEFRRSGLTPIVTHPERNPMLQQRLETILEMAEIGCVIQATAGSFTGFWGERTKRVAEWLLEKNAVHVLATDAHEARYRTPILSQGRAAVAAFAGEETAELLVSRNPEAILRGEQVDLVLSRA